MDEETVEEQVIDEGQIADQQEVLEEVVTTEEVYNENGDIVQYEDIVVYEEGSHQEIVEEEYVDLDELQDGEEYSYMITDENGETRYIPANEMRELVNSGQVLEDVVHEEVEIKDEKNLDLLSEEGPSQPKARNKKNLKGNQYAKRGRVYDSIYVNKGAPTLRDLVETIASSSSKEGEVVYMDGDQYYDERGNLIHNFLPQRSGMGQVGPKRQNLNDMAKVEVEKTLHRPNIMYRSHLERPTHKTNTPYFSSSAEKRRKLIHPISIDEMKMTPSMKPITSVDALDPSQYRYRCPECEEVHHSLDKLCSHLMTLHDVPASIQQTDLYDENEFNKFLMSIEKAGCTPEELAQRFDKKKTRNEQSQFFRCNYMFKTRATNYAEMVDISSSATNETEETCPAFVLKVHTYDSIRLRYCGLHVHADANIGFRVPIAVKRRLMEWLYKRIPIPVMQMLLISEADKMSQAGRVEQQLRDLSTNQLAALLSKIHMNFTLYEKLRHQHLNPHLIEDPNEHVLEVDQHVIYSDEMMMKPHEVQIEEVEDKQPKINEKIEENAPAQTEEGVTEEIVETVEVGQAVERRGEEEEEEQAPVLEKCEETVAEVDKEELTQPKMMSEPVLECEGEQPATYEECLTISIPEHLIYDPETGNDVVIDEINEVELKFLEAYESDAQIILTEKQQVDRNRRRLQFMQSQILEHFSNLDTLTHGMTFNDYELEMLEELRNCATQVLEVVCGVEAEIRAQSFISLPVDAIKNDLIASVSSKERRYVTSEKMGGGRRRPHITPLMEAEMKEQEQIQHEIDEVENAIIEEDIYSRVNAMAPPHRSIGINSSGTFSLTKPDIPKQIPTPELTLRDVVMMDTGRTPKPWYKYSQRKSETVTTTRPVLEVPNRGSSSNSDLPSTSSSSQLHTRVAQILNKASEAAAVEPSEGTSTSPMLPIKRRGRKRKDPLTKGVPEEDSEKKVAPGITTDDNVPHAIAMGVDQEVTVSTEETIEDTDEQAVEKEKVVKTEKVEVVQEEKVVVEEAEKEVQTVEQPTTSSTEEPEVVTTPTVTRTGRIVKVKKWSD